MLNIMEAADPHGGDCNEDNRSEIGPKLSTLQFPTQYSVVTAGPPDLSIQRPRESLREGMSSSIGNGMMIAGLGERIFSGTQTHETTSNSFDGSCSIHPSFEV